jgi:PEGA domain
MFVWCSKGDYDTFFVMRTTSLASLVSLLLVAAGIPAFAQQATGYLKTNINPGRAGVFIDGKYVGPAANFRVGRKYAISPGEHEVKLVEPRYEDVISKVTIQAGKTTKLAETMKALPPAKPPFGILRTEAPDKFSAVYVNGRFMGHAGEFNNSMQGLQLNPGSYAVKIVPASGGDGHEEQVTITADKTTIVHAK